MCLNFNAELVLSGAGRFFLKLLVDDNLLLSYGMARVFIFFCGSMNLPVCSAGLSQVRFDRDGESVVKRFLQVQHSSTVILRSLPIGVELPYLIYSQVALQCLVSCTFSVFRSASACVSLAGFLYSRPPTFVTVCSAVHGFSWVVPYFMVGHSGRVGYFVLVGLAFPSLHTVCGLVSLTGLLLRPCSLPLPRFARGIESSFEIFIEVF